MVVFDLRKNTERGHTLIDWLDSYHSFSFGDYYDPRHMGFGPLRVINDDTVKPGQGFSAHAHKDMEIVTYVLQGQLAHKDNMGNGSVILSGDVQRMSAGTGITHSEYNHSGMDPVHFLQIWILPEQQGLKPSYEQKTFPIEAKRKKWCLLASRDGKSGSVIVHQDVNVYATMLNNGEFLDYQSLPNRFTWIHVATGKICMNDHQLASGDGGSMTEEEGITFQGLQPDSEVFLFDMAKPEHM